MNKLRNSTPEAFATFACGLTAEAKRKKDFLLYKLYNYFPTSDIPSNNENK